MKKKRLRFLFMMNVLCYMWIGITGAKEHIIAAQTEENNQTENITIEDFVDSTDFTEIQEILDKQLEDVDFSFWDSIKALSGGKGVAGVSDVVTMGKNVIQGEIKQNKSLWLQCFSIAIIVGMFSNFSMIFKNYQVGETGFYIGYLMLFAILFPAFYSMFRVAQQTMGGLILFMKTLLPVFFMMVATSSGAGTASTMYSNSLIMIGGVEFVIGKVLLPFLEIYFVLSMLNYISKEAKISKLVECLESIIKWGQKGIVGLVLGMNTIQGLLLPAVEEVKKNAVLKAGGAIPVVGDAFTSVAETVLSVASLMKNAVGVAGIIAMILLCAVPILKILLYTLIFKITAAILEPLGEKRICECFHSVAATAGMLLRLEGTALLLFSITILILSSATG